MQFDLRQSRFGHTRRIETEREWAYCPLIDRCLACLFEAEQERAENVLRRFADTPEESRLWTISCLPGSVAAPAAEWARDLTVVIFGDEFYSGPYGPAGYQIDTSGVPWAAHYRLLPHGVVCIDQCWLRRVRYRDTPLYIEERWDPTMSELRIVFGGLEHVHKGAMRLTEVQRIMGTCLRLLRKLDGRGRPAIATTVEKARAEQEKVKRAIRKRLRAGEPYNRADIEVQVYGKEQGGTFLDKKIHPALFTTLDQEVQKYNRDYSKAKRKKFKLEQ
jgi:hypothetical protein